MNKLPRTEKLSYLWAALAVAVAFGVRWALLDPRVPDDYTFWFFVPAVAIASWLGGLNPGVFSTLLSIGAGYAFIRLHTHADPTDPQMAGIALFAVSSLSILCAVQALRRSLRREIVSRPVVEPMATPVRRDPDRDRRYKTILDNTLDAAIITMDTNRVIREWNVGATQITGFTRGEMIGRSADELFAPEDAESEPALEQLVAEATGKAAFARWLKRRDGTTFYAEGSLRVVPGDLEEPPGFIKVFTDGTARIQNRNNMLDAIMKRAQDAEVLTYSMAHDMRQYTRGLNVNATMIVRDLDSTLSEEQKHSLNRLRENATRMYQMVEGILDHLRLARSPITAKPVNLSLLAEEAVERLQTMDGAGKIHFIVQPGLWVKGDKELLALVFDNLFGNAVKYANGRVVFGHDARKDAFYVRDEGPGFEPQYTERIFNVFERLHGQDIPGTGIGLANVRRIIERHGGSIRAESEPGKGATFYFTLKASEQTPVSNLL